MKMNKLVKGINLIKKNGGLNKEAKQGHANFIDCIESINVDAIVNSQGYQHLFDLNDSDVAVRKAVASQDYYAPVLERDPEYGARASVAKDTKVTKEVLLKLKNN